MKTNTPNVENLVSNILPEKETRDLCLTIFADAIREAHERGYDWVVHCKHSKKKVIRLFVNDLIVVTLERGQIWFALYETLLSEANSLALRESPAWKWASFKSDYPRYPSIGSRNGFFRPSGQSLELWAILRPLHFRSMAEASRLRPPLQPTTRANHCPDFLRYLRLQLVPDRS